MSIWLGGEGQVKKNNRSGSSLSALRPGERRQKVKRGSAGEIVCASCEMDRDAGSGVDRLLSRGTSLMA